MSPYLPSPIRVARPNCEQTQEPEGQQGLGGGGCFLTLPSKTHTLAPAAKPALLCFTLENIRQQFISGVGSWGAGTWCQHTDTSNSILRPSKSKDQLHSRHLAAGLHGTWFSLLHSTHTHLPTKVGPAHRHLSRVKWTDTMTALLRAPPSQQPRHQVLAKKACLQTTRRCGVGGN